MNKKGIKKYYPGVNGLTTGASANTYGVLAPKPSSGTPLIDNLIKKSMTNEGFKETMPKEKGPSFEDKAGNVLSKSGGVLGMLAPLLIKQPNPNERPYKKGTKNLDTNMKTKKYDDGVGSLANNPKFQNMMSGDIVRGTGAATPLASEGPRVSSVGQKVQGRPVVSQKPSVRQKSTMTPEMQKVARLQQKMRDAGYNIKVDGIWKKGGETERAYQGYIKDKAADASRRVTVNTGQGPTIQNQRNLVPAMSGKILPEVTITAPAKKTYNQFDSPVLRQANMEALGRWRAEDAKTQAIADAKRKAREAEIARNSQSLPSASSSNRFTFNAADKGQGQDVTIAQDNALKRNRLVGDGATSKNSTRVQYNLGTAALKAFSNKGLAGKLGPSKLPSGVIKKSPSTTFNPMPVDSRPGMEAIRNYKPAGPKIAMPPLSKRFEEGAKKVSGYKKLDMKLGGLLPGGVSRAEYKAAKAAKNATPEGKFGPMAGGYAGATKTTTGVGPLAGGYGYVPVDASKPAGPMTDVKRYMDPNNMPAATPTTPAKKSLKAQYEENKGGYARALKSGKKDAEGNLVDPNTGLAYKKLPTKTGGAGKSTTPSKPSLFQGGKSTKNFKDPNSGISFYTNNRAFDEKSKKMGTYVHDSKTNKLNIKWDKPKAAPKRKGDDTYMDEVIDISSRAIGSIGGAALLGGSTFGAGSVAGAVGGDIAGKKFGNWLNKKLGYREENDTSQEGYSLGEAGMATLGGGVGGKLIKPVGGALIKFAGKEGAKMAAAPLGRAVAATGRAAGKLVGRGGSKAAAQEAGQVASQGAKQSAKLVNAPGSVSKVAPTAQSSLSVGNVGKAQRMVRKGANQPYTAQPAAKPSTANPNQLLTKRGGNTASATSQPAASTAQVAQNTAKSSVSKTRAAARLAKQKGKQAIKYAQNNKKKVALGAVGGSSLVGGGYALSQMRTSGE
jgi:hypothetical protein